MNPFTALGLPVDPGLTDEQVRVTYRTSQSSGSP